MQNDFDEYSKRTDDAWKCEEGFDVAKGAKHSTQESDQVKDIDSALNISKEVHDKKFS